MECSGVGFLRRPSAFQLLVWGRMHLWGNRGFGPVSIVRLRLMSSSDSVRGMCVNCVLIWMMCHWIGMRNNLVAHIVVIAS